MASEKEKPEIQKIANAVQIVDRAVALQRAVETAREEANQPTLFNDGLGHEYIVHHGFVREVRVEPVASRTASLGTVGALTEYLKRHGTAEHSSVVVSKTGILAVLDLQRDQRDIETVVVPFFQADFPKSAPMELGDFLDWIDCSAVAIAAGSIILDPTDPLSPVKFVPTAENDALRRAFDTLTVSVGQKASVEVRGAVISLRSENSARGEIPIDIPRFIQVTLPVGTHEYCEPFVFKLTITPGEGSLKFQLRHVGRDRAIYRWLSRCVGDLKAGLGEGWSVVEGA